LKNRDNQSLSSIYLNYLERGRGLPPDYLLEQAATVLLLPVDVLYFWARRLPTGHRTGRVYRGGSHRGGV
jgi:hypothetical protein